MPSQEKGGYLIIDSRLKEVIENKKTFLNGRSYKQLPYPQKIAVSQFNKKISELSWQCFEQAKAKSRFDAAVRYFVMAFELGWEPAIELYSRALRGGLAVNLGIKPSKEEKNKILTPYQYALRGFRYTLALGLPPDLDKALFCFKRAALRGNTLGMCGYGMALEHRNGVIRHNSEATLWYQKATERSKELSSSKSTHHLALIIDYPNSLCEFAAEQGNSHAQKEMGIHYQSRNREQELYWFRLAAEQGSYRAQFYLWRYYQSSDLKLALYWFRLAYLAYRNLEIENLGNFGSLGEYTYFLLKNDFSTLASLILRHNELKKEFLQHELDRALASEEGFIQLTAIIKSLTEDAQALSSDNNNFLSVLLISLLKKATSTDKNVLSLISPLIKALRYAEIYPDQIENLMKAMVQIWSMDKGDSVKGLSRLWNRAQSIGYQVEDRTLLGQIASILISTICNQAYVLNRLPFDPLQISQLFAYYQLEKNLSVDKLNLLLGAKVLSSEQPTVDQSKVMSHQFFRPPTPKDDQQNQLVAAGSQKL